MKIPLEKVESSVARLWEEEARRSGAPRMELMTLVALVSEPSLADRAHKGVGEFVRVHPSRTLLVQWADGVEAAITAEVALHRPAADGPACGDAIRIEALGRGREWLPDNVERLALADLPVCLWWIGDLPDFDHLLERMLGCADLVVVNSGEMDLRDLEKLAEIVARCHDRYALIDLTWVRLRPMQDLVARFFDNEIALGCLPSLKRVTIEFVPRERELDVASTQAGLLFGWIANALGLRAEGVRWKRGEAWAEAQFDDVVVHFEQRRRGDLPAGSLLRVALDCDGARFEIERQDDPCVFRWSQDAPGASVPPQTLHVAIHDEISLLVRGVERPSRDPLFEASLRLASRIVRPVAPRLSTRPAGTPEF